MISIEQGLVNSLIVLELLRNNESLNDFDVTIGTFTNCRECGLTFRVSGNKETGSFTWCVYEHRNSDQIIVNGKPGYVCLNGELPYRDGTKWDYLQAFSPGDYENVAEYLVSSIADHFSKEAAPKDDLS